MIKSMTGFGRAEEIISGRDIIVEIRSVNHRYFEFSARVPRAYGYLEEKLKSYISGKISRGKVEVSVTVTAVETSDALIEVNKSVAKGYVDALRSANEELGLTDDLTLSKLIRLPDIFSVRKTAEDEEVIWNDVKTVADKASDCFIKMRETEGEKMKEDVLERADAIEEMVFEIERLSPFPQKATETSSTHVYARCLPTRILMSRG